MAADPFAAAAQPISATPAASAQGTDPFAAHAVPVAATPAADPFAAHAVAPNVLPSDVPTPHRSQYDQFFKEAAAKYGVPQEWLESIHLREDAADSPTATSSAGARGLMQTMPGTFEAYNPKKGAAITDPEANILAGANYFHHLLSITGNNIDAALQSYNEGEGAYASGARVPAYSTWIEKTYDKMTRSGILGPAHQNATLPKGGRATVPAPSRTTAPRLQDPFSSAPGDPFAQTAQQPGAGDKAEAAAGEFQQRLGQNAAGPLAAVYKNMPPEARERLARFETLPGTRTAVNSVRLVTDLLDLPFDTADTVFRGINEHNTKDVGALGTALFQSIAHPQDAGKLLDQMANNYGLNSRGQIQYWAMQPGIRERLAAGSPSTPLGMMLQAQMGAQADWSRFIINKPAITAAATFTGEFFNPSFIATGVAGTLVRNVAGKAAKGVAAAADAADATVAAGGKITPAQRAAQYASGVGKKATAAKDIFMSRAPIVSSRYYMMGKELGVQGENAHANLVAQQAQARYMARTVLGQEHLYGNTAPADRLQIWQEDDRFRNQRWTLHAFAPGEAHPHYDSLTQSTTMVKGPVDTASPAFTGNFDDYVYAKHVDHPVTITQDQVPEYIMGPTPAAVGWRTSATKAAKFPTEVNISDVMQRAGMSSADADVFASQVVATMTAKGLKATQKGAFVRNAIQTRTLADVARTKGIEAIEVHPGINSTRPVSVILPNKIESLIRNEENVGQFTVWQRAMNVGYALDRMDQSTLALAPSVAKELIKGYHPRGGAFESETSMQQSIMGERSMQAPKGAVGGLQPGQTAEREYSSIAEALNKGEKINPKFDPADAAERAAARHLRFQNYIRFAMRYSEPINYDQAVKDAYNAGLFGARKPLYTPPDFGALGPTSRKAFEQWVADEARERLAKGLAKGPSGILIGRQTVTNMSDGQLTAAADAEKKHIFAAIEQDWQTRNPKKTWRTDKDLGVDEFAGRTIPRAVKDADIDSHPIFEGKSMAPRAEMFSQDPQENFVGQAVETVVNGMRSALLANYLYHPWANLSKLAFGFGHLSPVEVAQALFAPGTIDEALLKEAEGEGALQRKFAGGPAIPRIQVRYSYASPPRPQTIKGQLEAHSAPAYGNSMTLPDRMKVLGGGFANASEGDMMHALGKAWFNLDQGNQEWTFQIFEDAMAAKTYGKLKKIQLSKGANEADARAYAARETRKILGDVGNLAPIERRAGLNRLTWFYAWIRGQMRLWGRMLGGNQRAWRFATAEQTAVRRGNESSMTDDPTEQNPFWNLQNELTVYVGDKPYTLGAGSTFGKAQAMETLATLIPFAPVLGTSGFDSFASFAGSQAEYSLDPRMRFILMNLPQTLGQRKGEEPSPMGTIYDKDVPGPPMNPFSDQGRQVGNSILRSITPPEAGNISKAVSSPIHLLGLLGVPVKDVSERQQASVYGMEITRLRKAEDQLRATATEDPQADASYKQSFGDLIFQNEEKRRKLFGY